MEELEDLLDDFIDDLIVYIPFRKQLQCSLKQLSSKRRWLRILIKTFVLIAFVVCFVVVVSIVALIWELVFGFPMI